MTKTLGEDSTVLERLVKELPIPVIVKETGCGISKDVAIAVKNIGIEDIDVSGAGGTSWVAVETHRAMNLKSLGEQFWDWGIPTAASVIQCSEQGMTVCSTGGMRNGLMVAKAIALGASCGGLARVVLQAYDAGGAEGAKISWNEQSKKFASRCCSLVPKQLQSYNNNLLSSVTNC